MSVINNKFQIELLDYYRFSNGVFKIEIVIGFDRDQQILDHVLEPENNCGFEEIGIVNVIHFRNLCEHECAQPHPVIFELIFKLRKKNKEKQIHSPHVNENENRPIF